ncbi:hypothetical protein CDL15_Pgr007957 [Punica granatum]|uniref:Uncharacterized protein n=1 Tax=Punica granatum TaxID=22663 RepID=A0A218XAV3_PUNGR|nr:hypothetical protein CDL15_Pgr007957 [Punica granatum]
MPTILINQQLGYVKELISRFPRNLKEPIFLDPARIQGFQRWSGTNRFPIQNIPEALEKRRTSKWPFSEGKKKLDGAPSRNTKRKPVILMDEGDEVEEKEKTPLKSKRSYLPRDSEVEDADIESSPMPSKPQHSEPEGGVILELESTPKKPINDSPSDTTREAEASEEPTAVRRLKELHHLAHSLEADLAKGVDYKDIAKVKWQAIAELALS